ncbi:MAG: sugar phosphate nucleotidyltransferase [Acidimicrobiales bacterium]
MAGEPTAPGPTRSPPASPSAAGAAGDVAAVVLAAGAGTRLRPLTRLRPKPLCPVGGRPLLDHALERVGAVTGAIAVNAHHGRYAIEHHLRTRHPDVQLSVEEPVVLGTAGALGQLRWWIDGRPVLVANADTWSDATLGPLLEGWDGERVRVLVHGGSFGPRASVVASLLPWRAVVDLVPEFSSLWSTVWAPAVDAGRLESVEAGGDFFDCGTPASYLAANLHLADQAGGAGVIADDAEVAGAVQRSVVGSGARVAGTVRESVVWDGAVVAAEERLTRAIRADDDVTVLVR